MKFSRLFSFLFPVIKHQINPYVLFLCYIRQFYFRSLCKECDLIFLKTNTVNLNFNDEQPVGLDESPRHYILYLIHVFDLFIYMYILMIAPTNCYNTINVYKTIKLLSYLFMMYNVC